MCMFLPPGGVDNRGMHIEAAWHRVSDGTWYMDQVTVSRLLIEADVVCTSDVCD
jgi:hypothetical protein